MLEKGNLRYERALDGPTPQANQEITSGYFVYINAESGESKKLGNHEVGLIRSICSR